MHQSPRKEFGAPRRGKYAGLQAWDPDEADERRLQRGSPPKARRFQRDEGREGPREERPRHRG